MDRKELIQSPEYWITQLQNSLYNVINNYMTEKNISKSELAKQLGVSKGYISQILNGDFDHKISKLVSLALQCNKVPVLQFKNISDFLNDTPCITKGPIMHFHIHTNEPYHAVPGADNKSLTIIPAQRSHSLQIPKLS